MRLLSTRVLETLKNHLFDRVFEVLLRVMICDEFEMNFLGQEPQESCGFFLSPSATSKSNLTPVSLCTHK